MTSQVPLRESQPVTLDSSGNGTAKLGPAGHGETWQPATAGVVTSSAAKIPTCFIYVGSDTSQANFRDATYTGSQNNTDRIAGDELRLGRYVIAVWKGGDPGAQATLTVTGTKIIP